MSVRNRNLKCQTFASLRREKTAITYAFPIERLSFIDSTRKHNGSSFQFNGLGAGGSSNANKTNFFKCKYIGTILLSMLAQHRLNQHFDKKKQLQELCVATASERNNRITN